MTMILVGVDASERSEDAIALGLELARTTSARVVVATVFADDDVPTRADNAGYRFALEDDARAVAQRLAEPLTELGDERIELRTIARLSPAHGLHDLAEAEGAAIIVVGSSHTGRLGRVLPGGTGERLLHGAPCAVVVVPLGYRSAVHELRRIGVADDGSVEARAALRAATELTLATGGELQVIRVQPEMVTIAASPDAVGAYGAMREAANRDTLDALEKIVDAVEPGAHARAVFLEGDPATRLAEASRELDLLLTGSRTYGPLRSVLVGGVTGPLLRDARCPVLVVPRGVEAPLGDLLAGLAATHAADRPT
jgi:nucleotide-binding universal stress UspA family protein